MGGRLDSTNVLSAPVVVVTNIHDEHAEVIGPTLPDIAFEKAGIITPDATAIIGLPPVGLLANVFKRHAKSCQPHAKLQFLPPMPHMSIFEHNLTLAQAAVQAVARLYGDPTPGHVLLSVDAARKAVATLPARQQRFCVHDVDVIVDGAHVANSVEAVLSEFEGEYATAPVVVLALARDKKVSDIARVLVDGQPLCIVATQIGASERDLLAGELADVLTAAASGSREDGFVSVCEEPVQALDQAIVEARRRGTHVVVLGSLYLAGKLLPHLREISSDLQSRQDEAPDT